MKTVIRILVTSLLPLSAFAETETVNGITWTYTVSNGEASVGGGSSSSPAVATSTTGSITIPETLGGYSVKSIGSSAFEGCSMLTLITIPDGVTSIGPDAFYYCSGLTSITIPDGVTGIARRAFYGCSGLTSITIPAGVTSIGQSAFGGCSGLTSITIPNSVTSIGQSAFGGCSGLTSITIPSSVTSIEEGTFQWCSGLTSVTIPDGVTSIGRSAFSGCSGATSITIPDSVTNIGVFAFDGCSELYDTMTIPNVRLVDGWAVGHEDGLSGSLDLTECRGIQDQAFYGCSGLTSVMISDGVTRIGEAAFSGCSKITSITIPDSVTSIGRGAFYNCYQLAETRILLSDASSWATNTINSELKGTRRLFVGGVEVMSITIPDGVTNIGDDVFSGCSGLTSITIPDGVTGIARRAFYGCSGLTSITIPDGVTSIGNFAFYDCSGLTSITIPKTVTSIGIDAFYNCYQLAETRILLSDASSWATNTINSELKGTRRLFVDNVEVMNITIPDGVTSISDSAFSGCSGLTSITIPDSVTSIGNSAFSGCYKLTSATIGNRVTSIGDSAFSGCSGLTSITIPAKVTSIGNNAFANCFRLAETQILLSDASSWATNTINSQLKGTRHLFVDNVEVMSITIPDGVTRIGDSAFSGCSGLTSITIPDSVRSIGDDALKNCSGLTEIRVDPNNPRYDSRDNCNAIIDSESCKLVVGCKSTQIPDGVTSIGSYAFYNCSGLISITIPDSVTSLGDCAFYNCSGLTSITVPDSVTSIGSSAFSGCSAIRSVIVPGTFSLKTTFPSAYASITNAAVVPSSTDVANTTFAGCSGLKTVSVPQGVTNIASRAFSDCSSLEELWLPGSFQGRTGSLGIRSGCTIRFHRLLQDDGVRATGGDKVAFSAPGETPWTEWTDASLPDGACLRSGAVEPGGRSRLFASIPRSGQLSFDWKISAGRGDYCRFYINGTLVKSIQRSTAWATVELMFDGPCFLEWVYERGTGSATGEDAAFLDNVDWRPKVKLSISSEFGTPDPATGTYVLCYGDSAAASVAEPAGTVDMRRVCTGWTGTGSVPASGATTAVSFAVTNDSSLVWNWRTDYRMALSVVGPVAADFSDGWIAKGETKVVNWAPSVPYYSVEISGTTAGATLDTSTRKLSLPADRARDVTLTVTEHVIDFSAEGPVSTDFADAWGADTNAPIVVHWTPTVPYFHVRLEGDADGVEFDEENRTLTIPTTRSRTLSLQLEEFTLADALDTDMLVWTTDETAPWFPQVGTSADGEDAAQASPVAGDGASGLETTLEGAGTLSWTWRLSSDDNTGVDVFLDGEWLDAYAPGTDWSEASLDVAGSGTHTVRFEFWNAGTTADATAWIDRVDWTGDAPFGGRLRLVSATQTEAVFSTTAYTGGDPTPVSRILEIAADATFASVAKSIPLADVTEKTVEMVSATGLSPETGYWARLRLSQGGAAWTSDAVPFATPAHVAPALGTLLAEDLALTSATAVVPVNALGSDGGAVELSLVVTKAVEGATVATLSRTVSAAGEARFELSGLEAETVYRLAATARSVATGLETSATGGFTTAAHTPPALGTPAAEARTVGAMISVPVTALGSDGGAVEVSVAATVANTGEAAGTAAPATLAAPGTAVLDLKGLAPETAYRFVVTARAVATGHETTVSGGFTTKWAETPRIAAGGSGSGELPAICFLPSASGTGEDFVVRIDNPVPGLWYPVYTNGTPGGRFAVQSCGTPESAEGGYIVRVPAVESALFVKVGISKTRLEPGTPEREAEPEEAEWTTGTYSNFSPAAVSDNLLRQSGVAYIGENIHESEDGYSMDDPATMTNGSIDSGLSLSDKQYRFAVGNGQTLSWSFPSAATIREVRVYNIWGDSGRDRINIESVDALVGGSWVPLAPDSVCCQDSSAGSYDDGKPGRPYAILAAPNGGAIATGATALRIVWGTAESGFVGVGEVEVIGSF